MLSAMSCAVADAPAATVSAVVASRVFVSFMNILPVFGPVLVNGPRVTGGNIRGLSQPAPTGFACANIPDDLCRVERAAIVGQPADLDLLARLQAALIGGVACLDDELIGSC